MQDETPFDALLYVSFGRPEGRDDAHPYATPRFSCPRCPRRVRAGWTMSSAGAPPRRARLA